MIKKVLIISVMILFSTSFCMADSPSDLAEKCRNRCVDAGNTGVKLRECIKECNKIENCGPDFQKCIKAAKTEKAREACQEGYRKCKGE